MGICTFQAGNRHLSSVGVSLHQDDLVEFETPEDLRRSWCIEVRDETGLLDIQEQGSHCGMRNNLNSLSNLYEHEARFR